MGDPGRDSRAPDAKYCFIANVAIVLGALIYLFGYPFLIYLALLGAGSALVLIVLLTASDLFDEKSRDKHSAAASNRERS